MRRELLGTPKDHDRVISPDMDQRVRVLLSTADHRRSHIDRDQLLDDRIERDTPLIRAEGYCIDADRLNEPSEPLVLSVWRWRSVIAGRVDLVLVTPKPARITGEPGTPR